MGRHTWSDLIERVAKYILSANGTVVLVMSMKNMSFLLTPTLEVDVANIAVCLGNFYQNLLRCNALCGHNEALGPATIGLPGMD